jgi:hypothetical protein
MDAEIARHRSGRLGLCQTASLGAEHLEQLPATSHQRRQRAGFGIGQRTHFRLHADPKQCEQRRLNRIGFRGAGRWLAQTRAPGAD